MLRIFAIAMPPEQGISLSRYIDNLIDAFLTTFPTVFENPSYLQKKAVPQKVAAKKITAKKTTTKKVTAKKLTTKKTTTKAIVKTPAAKTKIAAKKIVVVKKPAVTKVVVRKTALAKYTVQIAAFRSKASAENGWRSLVKKHRTNLASQPHSVARVNLGKKGIYFRLRAGTIFKCFKVSETLVLTRVLTICLSRCLLMV